MLPLPPRCFCMRSLAPSPFALLLLSRFAQLSKKKKRALKKKLSLSLSIYLCLLWGGGRVTVFSDCLPLPIPCRL